MQERTAQALGYFMSKGWTREQAAGIVGNLIQESSLNTGARNPGDGSDGTDSIGVAQWNSGRARGLKKFASSSGADWTDFTTQLAYVDHELRTSEGAAGQRLRSATTVEDATAAFIGFERPQGWSPENPRGGHGWSNRLNHARSALGLEPLDAPVSQEPSLFEAPNPYQTADVSKADTMTDADIWDPQPRESYGLFDAVGDSFSSDSFTAWGIRRATEGAFDPAWKGPSAEEWDGLSKTISPDYYDYVIGAGSAEAMQSRIKYAQEDAERQQRLGELGASGLALRLATSVFDPVTLPMNLLTGGAGAAIMAGSKGASLATRAGVGALAAGASSAAVEASMGAITDDPHSDPLMAFGVGAMLGGVAGGLTRKKATAWEANELRNLGEAATRQARGEPDAVPYVVGGDGSMGAAFSGKTADDWILDPQDVGVAAGGKARFDVVGQMTTAPEERTRLMGFLFGEETVGRKDRGVVEDPVTVKRKAHEMRRWARVDKVVQPARRAWLEERGVIHNPAMRARKSDEFNELVLDAIEAPQMDPDVSPHVAKAAGAYRDFYATYQKDIKNPRWESGGYAEPIADVDANPNYTPLYANHAKIADIANQVPEKTMQRFITNAITAYDPDIDMKLAQRMARGYWINIRKAGYGVEDRTHMALNTGDRELFKESFRAANTGLKGGEAFDDDEIDAMFDALTGMRRDKAMAGEKSEPRLKRRTLMDYAYEAEVEGFGRLKMRDLFNKDIEFITRRYNRTMSARIALAQTQVRNPRTGEVFMDGIRSEADFDKLKNWVKDGWRERGEDFAKSKKASENAIENMEFMWNGIHGRPIYGSEKEMAQWIRRIKAFQFIRLMNNMGLNQVQESWKIVGTLGAKAAFQQLPAIRRMVDSAGVSRPKQDELLDELEDITGFGLEGLFGRHDFALMEDRIGAIDKGRSMGRLDVALDWGQKITADISFMKALMTYQQRWAIKAVSQRLYDIAKQTQRGDGTFDFSKLGGREADRLRTAGIGEDEAKLLFANMLKHGETDGKRLTRLGTDNWDPEAVTKLSYSLNRIANRLVQQNDVGGLAKWMSLPLAQLFTQFRHFVFGAWGKSTLYNMHHMDPQTFVLLMGELAFGVATFAVRSSGQLTTEDGRDRFWEQTMDPVNLLKNGAARTASSSILPMLADTALMFTPMGPQFGNARASGQATDALFGSPAGSSINELATFTTALGESVIEDRDMAQTELRAGWRSLPFANWMPLMGLFESMIEDRDPFPPRN